MPTTRPPQSTRSPKKARSTHAPLSQLAAHAVEAMLDKKAREITVMDLRGISGVADCFVIGTGDSDLQIKAIADGVREAVREATGERPWHVEGKDALQWVLLDYVNLVVHVFNAEKRAFYGLERLWGDAATHPVEDGGDEIDFSFLDQPPAPASKAQDS